jgi:serine/threonine-protein kinase PpkA
VSQARAVKKRQQVGARPTGALRRSVSPRPAWILPAIAVAALAVLGAGAWFAFAPGQKDPPLPASGPLEMTVTTPATPADAAPLNVPTPVDAPQSEVAALLTQADTYREYGTTKEPGRRLTYPQDDNAVDLYRKVLLMEPDNAQARDGLAKIAAYYLKSAQALCNREIWSQCGSIAADGLKAAPDDAELKALREKAEQRSRGG